MVAVKQGKAPLINLSAGTHAIYRQVQAFIFSKVQAKVPKVNIMLRKLLYGGDSVPSVNLPRGQWYIKTENGKYSVVDRESDDAFYLESGNI